MKTTYLVRKDPFCNGVNPEWQELTGQEFLAFIRLDENKKRRFIKLYSTSDDGSDGDIMIEAAHRQAAFANKEYGCCRYCAVR